MSRKIIVLSGASSSGKSALAARLRSRYETELLVPEQSWKAETIAPQINAFGPAATTVVDAAQSLAQIEDLREAFGRRVVHVHLAASDEILAERSARSPGAEASEEMPPKLIYGDLAEHADVLIDTTPCSEEDIAVRAACRLGLYGDGSAVVDIIVGGQYGSEGKGNIAFYLAPEYDLLVRVGGPNAGHKVPLDPPYTHRLPPSGTMAMDKGLLIGPGAVLNSEQILKEIADCGVGVERLAIDPQAMLISDSDIRREKRRLVGSIGSTGQGVGEATARRIRMRDRRVKLAEDDKRLQPYIRPASEVLERTLRRGERILIEGTQGTGLSLFHGSYPHVTSRDTTASGCLGEVGLGPRFVRRVIMVCRAYPIRVMSPESGYSGPMTKEVSWAEIARRSGLRDRQEITA